MAILWTNDECSTPGTVVCFDVVSQKRQSEISPNQSVASFGYCTASAGRIENGKMTRMTHGEFDSPDKFWDWLNWTRHARMPVWLFGRHIGTGLTLLGIWQRLTDGKMSLHLRDDTKIDSVAVPVDNWKKMKSKTGMLLADGPPTAIICYDKNGWRLTCLDLLNYFDCGIDKLRSLCGIDPAVIESNAACCDDDVSMSKFRVSVMMAAITKLSCWHRKQELGRFGYTISSCAMAAFRHRFMCHEIDMTEKQSDRDFEREGCYQGRVSCFWVGAIRNGSFISNRGKTSRLAIGDEFPQGPFHLVDSRSFYGAIGAWEEIPVKLRSSWTDGEANGMQIGDLDTCCMASVLIDSENDSYPVRYNDRQLFCYGRFWTTLCGPELMRAAKSGHIAKIGRGCKYELAPAFREYSTALWKERIKAEQVGDELISSVCKQLLARLHGKFQQRNKRWCDLPDRVAPAAWHSWTEIMSEKNRLVKMRSVGWDVQYQQEPEDSRICFPAISAWITSCGREWLRDWIRAVGLHNCLYCSTDSMIVTAEGLSNLRSRGLIATDTLGGLRVVSTSCNVEIRGPSNYTFGDKTVISGRHTDAKMIDGKKYHAEEWQSLNDIISMHGQSTVNIHRIEKRMPEPSVDGTVSDSGWVSARRLTERDQQVETAAEVDHGEANQAQVASQSEVFADRNYNSWKNTDSDWCNSLIYGYRNNETK